MFPHTLGRRLLVIGVPLAFAVVSVFHPTPARPSNLADEVGWWTTLHLLQIPMLLLMACAVLTLGWTYNGRAVTVSRVASLIFIATYPAYDSFAGLGTGFLVQHAQGKDEAAREVLHAAAAELLDSPLDSSLYVPGTLSWMVAVVSLAVALRHGPGGRAVSILFAAAGLSLIDHGRPFGVISFGLFAAGAALFEFRQSRAVTPMDAVPITA